MLNKVIIAAYVLATSGALILLKIGSKNDAPIHLLDGKIQFNITPQIVLGVVLYGVSFAFYTYLISKFDLGYIIPLATALVYIIIFFASFVFFKEPFTTLKVFAIALIVFGLILLNLKR